MLRLPTLMLALTLSAMGCTNATQPYKMIDQLMVAPDPMLEKEMKIHGWVEAGSISENVVEQEMHRSFVLQRGGKKVKVTNIGPKPDTFRDQSEVVATGILRKQGDDYVFEAKELQAKCPSKYEGSQSNKQQLATPQFR